MKKAGDLLSAFFAEHFDQVSLENGRKTAGLFFSWAAAAKAANIPAAADHSRVRDMEHKVLVVEADHPGWVQILQTKQTQLLRYVQFKFPDLDIQGISFCLSREPINQLSVVSSEVMVRPETTTQISADAVSETPPREKDETLYEPIKEFRRVIQKRNQHTSS
jgi:hypothetical protein